MECLKKILHLLLEFLMISDIRDFLKNVFFTGSSDTLKKCRFFPIFLLKNSSFMVKRIES